MPDVTLGGPTSWLINIAVVNKCSNPAIIICPLNGSEWSVQSSDFDCTLHSPELPLYFR